MSGGVFRNRRSGLVLIVAAVTAVLVALAGAVEAALDQVPSVFGDIEANEGAYAVTASRGGDQMITNGFGCSELVRDRSVTVTLIFPKVLPSASLSQHTVFVAKFEGDYWVWGIY